MNKEDAENIKFANRLLYEFQRTRTQLGSRLLAKNKKGYVLKKAVLLQQQLVGIEKTAEAVIKDLLEDTDIWTTFFKDIRGVSYKLASSLIAEIEDISKFDNITSLWAYFGLIGSYVIGNCSNGHKLIMSSDRNKTCPILKSVSNGENGTEEKTEDKAIEKEPCGGDIIIIDRIEGQAPRRIKGYHYLFNMRGKSICWKISEQMVRQGNTFYRNIYDATKEQQRNLNPGFSKMHIHNRAKRKMVKMFLSHLWEAWRKIEGLETRPPYVIEKLGHKGFVSVETLKIKIQEERGS